MDSFKLDFIGVGAAKAATTWLAQCLSEHPDICVSIPKELNYFCKTVAIWPSIPTHFDQGETWLQSRFSHSRNGQIKGEFSPSYLIDPHSAELIRAHSADTKIIISFRNPVDSLYALYFEIAREYDVPPTFEAFLDRYPHIISSGFYYTHAKRYLANFSARNIHCVVFDDICTAPAIVMSDLFRFLSVKCDYVCPSLHCKLNERRAPRSKWIRNMIGNSVGLYRRNPRLYRHAALFRSFGIPKVMYLIRKMNLHTIDFRPMREDTRARLSQIYCNEIVLISELLNRDLTHWVTQGNSATAQ
jgi:hypothetical protein